jgi:hypothetical protein
LQVHLIKAHTSLPCQGHWIVRSQNVRHTGVSYSQPRKLQSTEEPTNGHRPGRSILFSRRHDGGRKRSVLPAGGAHGLSRPLDPEAWGREPFAHGGYLLAKTDQLIYATGIANIWARDPLTMACAAKTLAEAGEGRFILGIGVSHRSLVEDLRGHQYDKPFSYMGE